MPADMPQDDECPEDMLAFAVAVHRERMANLATQFGEDVACAARTLPWSIDRLGPATTDGRHLAGIASAVVDHGVPRTLTVDGQEVRWIRAHRDLVLKYLGALCGAEGQHWKGLVGALEFMWATQSHADAQRFPESQRPVSALDFRPGAAAVVRAAVEAADAQSDHSMVSDHLGTVVGEALEQVWHQAFATGRILVFRQKGAVWQFEAPHVWAETPPMPCLSIEDLRRQFETRTGAGQIGPAIAEVLPGGGADLWLDGWGDDDTRLQPEQPPEVPFWFLLSRDADGLGPERSDKAANGGPRPKERSKVKRDLLQWFGALVAQSYGRILRGNALRDIVEEAARLTGQADGWNTIAEEVWRERAPEEWRQGGRPPRR